MAASPCWLDRRSGTVRGLSSHSSPPAPHTDEEARLAALRPPSIAAGGLDALLFRGIELVSLVLLVIVTARLMEPSGRGLYALASLTATLCGLPLGAVWVANTVEIARARTSLRELLGASIAIAMVGGLASGAVAMCFAPLLGDRWWVVALPAAVTPFILLARYVEGLYTGLGHVRAVNLIIVGRAVLPLVFIIPPLVAGASARTAIAIWTLSFVALPAIALVAVRSQVGGPQRPRERALYRRLLGSGTKASALNAVVMVSDRVGLIVLAVLATDVAVGIYSVAVAGAQVLLLTANALAISTFRRIGSDAREASAALTVRTIRHAILLAAVGGVALLPVIVLALPWTVGAQYDDVPWLLMLLIPGTIFLAGVTPLYTFFQVQVERSAMMFVVAATTLGANVLLAAALAPIWGVWGVAIAASVGNALGGLVGFWAFRRESGASLRDLRPGRRELRDYRILAESRLRRGSRVS